jgi:tight adherence protein B
VREIVLPNVIIFLVGLIVVFSIVMLTTSPVVRENAVTRRLRQILKSPSLQPRALSKPNDILPAAEPDNANRVSFVLRKTSLARLMQKLIFQSHVRTTPSVLMEVMASLAVAAYLIIWYFTRALPVSLFVAFIAGCLPLAYLSYRRKKWLAAFNAALPECIEAFTRSLRAGHSIVATIDLVAQQVPAPANAEFAEVFKKQKYGLPLRDALLQMIERVPSMDLKIMITAVLVQRETGGNLPGVLDRLVAVIRDRLRIQRDIRVHTAQGRLTGWILGILPPCLMMAINLISPNYSTAFLRDEVGRKMLYASVGLLLIGVLAIRRIVNGIEV